MHFDLKKDPQRILLVTLGSILYAFNINSFVHSGGLLPGGFSGLTLLIQEIFYRFLGIQLSYSLINFILNAIPIYISFRFIGKKFTLLSCYAIVLTGLLTDIIPAVHITSEPILVCVFGGLLNGGAIALCLLGGGTSGGTDFISIYMSEQLGKDTFNAILLFNVIQLLTAGVLFSWERALYSIIFQYASTQVLHVLYKRYQQQTLLIVTSKPEEVYTLIKEISHHGATLFQGMGLYEHKDRTMVYSVVAADEVKHIIKNVHAIDPHAFINSIKTNSLSGRFYRRPNE